MTGEWLAWEDYRAGMYQSTIEDDHVAASTGLLADCDQFAEAAIEMFREWPMATFHNLANMWSGRNAWVGQATCCYVHGATAASTRQAWGRLSNGQQAAANNVAVTVRTRWEQSIRFEERDHAQTLFGD